MTPFSVSFRVHSTAGTFITSITLPSHDEANEFKAWLSANPHLGSWIYSGPSPAKTFNEAVSYVDMLTGNTA